MKLSLTISEICAITSGRHHGPTGNISDHIIENIVVDSRSPAIWEKTLFVALKGKKASGATFVEEFKTKGGQFVLSDTPIDEAIDHILVDDALKALQKIAKHHRGQFDFPVIGITGSNGKTIVKEWLYHVMKDDFNIVRSPKSYNSQLGVPLSILEMRKENTLGIFEAGISKPGEMAALQDIIQPTHGIFTGIGDAHSANFDSKEQKKEEKFKLFQKVDTLFEGSSEDHNPDIPFKDNASKRNAALVYKTAKHFGLGDDSINESLLHLPSLSMRMEQITGKNGCTILNDAYSADLHSLEIALQHIEQFSGFEKKVLFLTPLEDNIAADRLEGLIDLAKLDKIVVIGSEEVLPGAEHFESVDAYLRKPDLFENSVLLFKGSRKVGLEKIVQVYADKKHITRLIIDFGAIRNNLNVLREQLREETDVLAMVKAQSYGGGMVEMAKFLESENVKYFGVAYADEGIELRKAGIKTPILVMNPEPNSYDDMIKYHLEPSVYSIGLLQEFIHELILQQVENYPIHLKLDTGMNRLGFKEEELTDLLGILQTQPEVYVKSIFSHLSAADDKRERDFTYSQIRKFQIMSGDIQYHLSYPVLRHMSNSAGTMNYPSAHFDMVRLGIGLFGLLEDSEVQFENALTLRTKISQIKEVNAGESIGYGRTHFAESDKRIAIIPVGYADGLRRELGAGTWSVIINGQKARIIGSVCMDMCMIDLDGIEAKRGDEVQIFGSGNSIFDMALTLRTIPYEIISSVSARVHRVYLEG